VICLISLFVVSGQPVLAAPFNKQINYQGKLSNSSGVSVANGQYNIRFKIYDASNNVLWTEDHTGGSRVTVTGGLFSVMLGSIEPITTIDWNQVLYLGVNIGGTGEAIPIWDGEMTPRKTLGAVPAAMESDKLDGLDSVQFVRTDATSTIATSSAETVLTINQTGAGSLLDLKKSGVSVFSVNNSGLASTSALLVSSTANIGGLLAVSGTGTSTFSSNLSVGSNLLINNDLMVTGSSNLSGLLSVSGTGTSSVAQNLSIGGDQSIAGSLVVTGTITNTEIQANTSARHNAVTIGLASGLSLNNQIISLGLADASYDGALASTSFATFTAKQNAITTGTTLQYLRGDLSLGTLDTSAVVENGNLYWTNDRFDTRLNATTSLANLATLAGLSTIGSSTGASNILGKLGVGTSSPSNSLEVVGSGYFTGGLDVGGDISVSNLTANGITLGGTYMTTWPAGGGGGEGSWWATSSDQLVGYPSLAGNYAIVIGGSATTSQGLRFEVIGNTKLSGTLTVTGKSTLVAASTTEVTVANKLTVSGKSSLQNASTTHLTVSTTATIGTLDGLIYGTNGQLGTISTSTLNINTDNLVQGNTNLFWSNALFDTRLAATTSLANLASLAGLSTIGSSTGISTILGKTVMTNASTTNLSASGWLTVTGNVTGANLLGTNTGDETQSTIFTKIGYIPMNEATTSLASITTLANLSLSYTQLTSAPDLTVYLQNGTSTSALTEGTNLFWMNDRFDTRLFATTSLANLATLSGLSTIGSSTGQTTILGQTVMTNASTTHLTVSTTATIGTLSGLLFGTNGQVGTISTSTLNINTDNLVQGSTNLFWSNALFDTRLAATTSLPNLASLAGLSTIGSSTGITTILGKTSMTNASTTNLSVSGLSYFTGTSSFAGNVGIGTVSPVQKLHLYTASGDIFQKFTSGTVDGYVGLYGNDLIVQSNDDNDIVFWDNAAQRMTIKDGGNVGIGTSTPAEALHVYGNGIFGTAYFLSASDGTVHISQNSDTVPALKIGSATFGWKWFYDTAGKLALKREVNNVDSDVISFDRTSGNIGIGTTSPSNALEVNGSGYFTGNLWGANVTATGTLTVSGNSSLQNASTTNLSASGWLIVDGNVGIGTSVPYNNLHISESVSGTQLDLHASTNDVGATAGLRFAVSTASGGDANRKAAIFFERKLAVGVGNLHFALNAETGNANNASLADTKMTITSAGYVGIGLTNPSTALSVNGAASSTGLQVNGNGTLTGTLNVTGNTTLGNASTTNLSVSGDLYLPTGTFGTGDLLVSLSGGMIGSIPDTLVGYAMVSGGLNTGPGWAKLDSSHLDLSSGTFSLNGGHLTAANITATGTLTVSGNSSLQNASTTNLSVSGLSWFTGTSSFTGKVGIGTAAPTTNLQITNSGTSGTSRSILTLTTAETAQSTGGSLDFSQLSTVTGRIENVWQSSGAVGLNFYTYGSSALSSKMTILGSGNVGIGTTTPSNALEVNGSGYFTGNLWGANITATGTLTVSGNSSLQNASTTNLTVSGNTYIGSAGDAGGLTIYATDDSDEPRLRISESGASSARFNKLVAGGALIFANSTNGVEMIIDGSGYVGIASTTPMSTLSVTANAGTVANTALSTSGITLDRAGAGSEQLQFRLKSGAGISGLTYPAQIVNSGSGALEMYTLGAKPLVFGTNSAENMRILSGGNVGIGTTSPSNALEVKGSGYFTGNLWGANITATGTLTVSGNSSLQNASTTALTVSGLSYFTGVSTFSGNVGIGVVTPRSNLHVSTSANNEGLILQMASTTNGSYSSIKFKGTNDVSGNTYAKAGIFFERTGAQGVGSLHLATNNVADSSNVALADAKLTVTSAGLIGIGTTSPSNKLEVAGSGYFTGNLWGANITATGTLTVLGNSSLQNASTTNLSVSGLSWFTGTSSFTGNVGIGTVAQSPVLVVGGVYTPLASINTRAAIVSNANNIQSFQLENLSNGTGAEMRFIAKANDGNYMAFTSPSASNTGAFFGVTKSAGNFVFNAGVSRALVIGNYLANDVVFGTNNAENMRIKSGGNIGIGTTSPSNKLEVNGSGWFNANLTATNVTATGTLTVSGNSTLSGALAISAPAQTTDVDAPNALTISGFNGFSNTGNTDSSNGGSVSITTGAGGNNTINRVVGNAGSITLTGANGGAATSGGTGNNGGIGGSLNFTSGNGGATVGGVGGAGGSLTLTAGNGGLPTGAGTKGLGGSITLNAGGNGTATSSVSIQSTTKGNVLLVTAGGNVGIGTAAPSTALDVIGTASSSALQVNGNGTITGALTLGTDLSVANGGTGAGTLTGLLQGNGTSAFTAITNSTTIGQALRVTGSNTYAWGAIDLADADAVTGILPDANLETTIDRTGFNASGQIAASYFTAGGVARNGSYSITLPNVISSNQTGYGIASGWTSYSDSRIKTDQNSLDYGLKEIMQLKPKRYVQHSSTFEDGLLVLGNGGTNIGLIAQEVFSVIPEVVVRPTDESSALWSIDYAKFAPVLIRAIQEQQTEISGLIPTGKIGTSTDYSLLSDLIKNGEVNMSDIWTIDRVNGKIKSLASLDMSNLDIENVKAIKSVSGNWSLTEEGVLAVKEIQTEKLCIGQTCITEIELKALLQTAGVSGSATPVPVPDDGSSSTQETPDDSTTTPPIIAEPVDPPATEPVVSPDPIVPPVSDPPATDPVIPASTPEPAPPINPPASDSSPPAS